MAENFSGSTLHERGRRLKEIRSGLYPAGAAPFGKFLAVFATNNRVADPDYRVCCLTNYLAHICSNYLAYDKIEFG